MSDVEWARLEDAPVKEKFGGTDVPCSFSILRVKLQPPKGAKDAKSRAQPVMARLAG